MKKRLLSAALALAMVLTMLPLSALPAFAAPPGPVSGSTRVTYYERIQHDKLDESGNTIGGSGKKGWYYSYTTQDANGKNVTRYASVSDGVVNNANGQYDNASGTWYSMTHLGNGSAGTLAITSFTLIGNVDFSTTRVLQQSINVDVNGKSFKIGINNDNIGKVSSINIYDKQYSNGGTTQGTFNETAGITSGVDKALNVKIDGAKTGAISLTGAASYKVEVVNKGEAGNITLGASGVTQMQTVTGTNATLGTIEVFGDRSHVNLTGVSTSGKKVDITGSGAHLTLSGAGSQIGAVTLASGLAEDKKTGAAPYVEINGGSATSVAVASGDKCTSEFKVTVNQGGTVTTTVNMGNAAKSSVTVNSGTITGMTTVPNGKVTVSGSYANLTAGVTLGATSKETELKVTGSHHTVGAITVSAGTAKLDIPADPTNNFTSFTKTAGDVNRGIAGGTWTTAPGADYLVNTGANAIRYTLAVNGKTTLYTAAQLGDALTAQAKNNIADGVKSVKAPGTGAITITFKDGNNTLGLLKCAPYEEFALPSLIDGRTYSNWMDGSKDWGLNYSAPDTGTVELNAKNTSNTVNKIDGITATGDAQYLDVSISGNVISLSGAVTGSGPITLNLKTNMGTYAVTAYYEHSAGKLSWSNTTVTGVSPTTGDGGMSLVLNNGELVLQLSNKTEYTLRNAGIKVPSTKFEVHDGSTDGKSGAKLIVENISSNAAKNDSDRTALKNLIAGTGSKFEWSGIPAIEQVLNAAKAGITDSQVTTWKQAGQREAFTKHSTGTYDSKNDVTGYDTVKLVPYLGIDITDYKPNGSITMKLNLKYRIEVSQSDSTTYSGWTLSGDKYPDGAYIAYTGTLGALTGGMEGPGISYPKVTFASGLGTAFTQAHQDGTYVYAVATNAITFKHPGTTGLGTVVINNTAPLVSLYAKYTGSGSTMAGDGTPQSYYDSIQAAVDNTQPVAGGGAGDTEDYIEVAQGYPTGNVAINVTGKARTFYIRTIGMTTITSATNGGGLIAPDSTGHLYTVKLNEDTTPATANVSVAGTTGGSASVNTTTAKPGDKITISLSASAGYTPSGVTVKTASGQSVSVSGSGSSYSFTMPAGATSVTVTPSFTKTTTTLPFTDVSTTAWYYNGVEYCYNTIRGSARLMQGMSATTFGPNTGFTRAQVVQILWNIKGCPEPKTTYNPYTDISSIHYAYKAMLWATQNGYAEGYVDNGVRTFRPNQNVTRQEMAVFLWRAAGKPTNYNSLNLNAYADGYMVYDWAQPAMRWAIARGVLSGQSSVALGNYLSPRTVAYRSEVAVTVMNFDKLAVFR